MSQHPSLRTSRAGKKLRSVLKRYERLFSSREKDEVKEGFSVFGMPKLKIVRAKIKKEKTEEKPDEGTEVVATGEGDTKKETAPKAAPKAEKGKKEKK